MAPTYVTGSQATQTLVSKALRRTPPRPITVAAPPYHAVALDKLEADGDRTAACGEVVRYAFPDHPWRRGLGSSSDWCPTCVGLLPGPG